MKIAEITIRIKIPDNNGHDCEIDIDEIKSDIEWRFEEMTGFDIYDIEIDQPYDINQ